MTPDQQQAAAEAAAPYAPAGTPAQASLVATIDVRADLSRVSVPTLVISTTEGRLVSPALHRQLAEAIPVPRTPSCPPVIGYIRNSPPGGHA
jgi:pimeloyl-ACP methyl ester carboxylesterase